MGKLYSVIIPVYNRPNELEELLRSLVLQTEKMFEVIIVEDGSSISSEHLIPQFQTNIDIYYYTKANSGPGDSRNFGMQKANTDFFIFFDSDCIIPPNYFELLTIELNKNEIDCYGGPDKAHPSFTSIQKAISYSMTSILTTGGIRGGSEQLSKFHPRSFNMGFSKSVYLATEGFSKMRFGEDVDFSLRVQKKNFNIRLLTNCFVYHKRRTDFKKFYKQIYNSGIARINLSLTHKGSFKISHLFPTCFVLGSFCSIVLSIIGMSFPLYLLILYCVVLFVSASIEYRNIQIGILAVASTWIQMYAYGLGFLYAFFNRIILKKSAFSAFEKNFYK
ncbi:MAG: glycosyltransferase [Cytophagales bacterium]|nr:MAG: glycosyltransferase [Cytophagales bacterium]